MFEINEMKFITRVIGQPFFLSPQSTFEYIMYHDIDHYNVIVDFDLRQWLLSVEKRYHVQIKRKDSIVEVIFIDERITLSVTKMKEEEFLDSLMAAHFNIESVAIKVSFEDLRSFSTYRVFHQQFYSSWMDPFHKRTGIRACLLEPIDYQRLENNGNQLYRMIELMARYNFDIHEETVNYLSEQKHHISFSGEDLSYRFFKILSYPNAAKYIRLLDRIGALEMSYPLIKQLKASNLTLWQNSLKSLGCLEKIIYSNVFFVDSVHRSINRNLKISYACGLNKLQLIKFSMLFYNAHLQMILKHNAPERYELSFTSFCSFFHMGNEACSYYSQVVKSKREGTFNLVKLLDDKEMQYEFFEEYQENTMDVLLLGYIDSICKTQKNTTTKKQLEALLLNYFAKFSEIQSINSEVTTLDLSGRTLSDAAMLLLLDEVKRKVFLGNIRYDRKSIIDYINKYMQKEQAN